jgi:hypothetical protein
MNKILDIKTLIILLLTGILIYKSCDNITGHSDVVIIDNIKYNVLKYKVDTVEKIKSKTEIKKGDDIFHERVLIDTEYINKDVDTSAILINFFSQFEYKDTFKLPDSLGYVFVLDTITQNKIKTRKYTARVIERIIDSTTIVKEIEKNRYYVGPNLSINKVDLVNSIGGSLIFKSKKNDNLYQFNTGIMMNNGTTIPYFGGGFYLRINK